MRQFRTNLRNSGSPVAAYYPKLFKNGLTGGFTSKIAPDRDNQRAVIVLSNTAAEVDSAADLLLVGDLAWAAAP